MANPNLSKLSIEALLDMRGRVDQALLGRRAALQNQLERMQGENSTPARSRGGRRKSAMKGKKVAPKYRDSAGNTWAGRGAQPRWLTAAIKGGAKRDDFLVDKSARKVAKKVRRKRRKK